MAAAAQKLVIVESPTKARTIRQYLGREYRVEASMGHVRDLPSSAEEIPEKIKGESWARMAVDVDHDFAPHYVVPAEKKKVVSELKKALESADELYIATDEDREGESIGWHLTQVLKPKVPTHRMVFHEITRDAILKALNSPRQIDAGLVQAQEARRILDRLVGYLVSPVLWKKVAPKLSAGRVQSVAVRLLVMRERERMRFRSGSYWDARATLANVAKSTFDANLTSLNGRRIATGRDFDEATGQLIASKEPPLLLDEKAARALCASLEGRPFLVTSLERKPATKSPYPPFTTSTLQQEANRKLGLGANDTMKIAQRLYENGHITYMRTDSVNLSDEAVGAVRSMVGDRYGADFLSKTPRRYATKTKGAQEAHEAIRPAGTKMATADELGLSGIEARLYDLIWKRTVATQMADARIDFTTVTLESTDVAGAQRAEFRASGREVVFPGFLRAYVEGADDPDQALDDQSKPLPTLRERESLDCRNIEALGHETRPPARFTEATLVKALEAEGIGRPSTYASIIDTIQRRGYVQSRKKELVPTWVAMAVTNLLERTHGHVLDVQFTADMESKLDAIATEKQRSAYLREFFESELTPGIARADNFDARGICTLEFENIAPYVVRVGKYGPYVEVPRGADEKPLIVNVPDEVPPADLTRETIEQLIERKGKGDEALGADPSTGQPVYVLTGRYGPFVQLGEATDGAKPRRTSLPRGITPENITLEQALALLALPRPIGAHPETQKPIVAGIGQYGPYVQHDGVYASLKATDDVLAIDVTRALELFAAKGQRGAGRAAIEPIRTVGAHPADNKPVQVFAGRYGAYVKHGDINATLPKGTTAESLTMDQAVALIAARAEAGPSTRKAARGRTATRSAAAAKPKASSRATATKSSSAKPAAARKAPARASAGAAAPAKAKKAAPSKAKKSS